MSKNSDSVGKKTLFFGLSAAALAAATAMDGTAVAQTTAPATEAESEEIVVTGFRRSLAVSLDIKRNATGIVDAITAEDIADFPDLNLAESIQRIPGVSIDRDAGEGRSITVRGLGSDFTRSRINGMEALATTGGTDSSGGANRTRQFDFNVFAADLFNSIKVTKTASASTEEGSLGATVDLTTARPFDYGDFTLSFSGQSGYNDLSQEFDPRGAFLISDVFLDGKLGALFSISYSNRSLLEEGFSTVRWEPAGGPQGNGGFEGIGSPPAPTATIDGVPTNEVYHPRIPRYGRLTHEQDRMGATLSLQWRPTDATELTLDALYSKFDLTRQEDFLEALSFSRNAANGGKPQTSIETAEVDENGNLVFGVFDDVDVRSESRFDELWTEFQQYTLNFQHDFTDSFRVRGLVGKARSVFKNPIQTTVTFEAINSQNYSWDFRDDDRLPLITYGFDPNNAASWSWVTAGAPRSEIRIRPQGAENVFTTGQLDLEFDITDSLTLSGGVNYKEFDFTTFESRRADETRVPVLPPGVMLNDISTRLTGFGRNMDLPAGTPTAWIIPDFDAVAALFNIYCNCDPTPGVAGDADDFRLTSITNGNARGNNRAAVEEDTGAYVQLALDTELGGMDLRGNLGVRYVETKVSSTGFLATGGGTEVTVDHEYQDTLPSLNVALGVTDDLIVRFGAAKVMARPQLENLNPGGALNVQASTLTSGNPKLDPFRATTYDLSVEWYFADESLLSLAVFYKEIDSFIQNLATQKTYAELGLPPGLAPPDQVFTVTQPINTAGGPLEGFEIGYQQPFTFLPGVLQNFGAIVNYTHVTSDIVYCLTATCGATDQVTDGLVRLSPEAYNATLYYEDEKLSARVSAAYRDAYLQLVPARNSDLTTGSANRNEVEGRHETLNVDASASYKLNDHLTFTFEGINLTDEFVDQFLSREADRVSVYHHTGRQLYLGFRYRY